LRTPANDQQSLQSRAAAIDAHPAPDDPTIERGAAPFATLVLPVSAVRLFISEGGVGFVQGGDRDRVGRLEATQLVLLFEIVVRDATIAFREIRLEEHDLDFGRERLGHAVHDLTVDVLLALSCVERFLRCAAQVHRDLADDEIRDPFDALAEGRKHIVDERAAGLREHGLDEFGRKARFTELRRETVADLTDLAVRDGVGLGRGLESHCVILSVIPFAEEAP
jgi:hypothetical protein